MKIIKRETDSSSTRFSFSFKLDRFYPIYPVPDDFVQDVNLDLTHLDLLNLETSPDILVMPSNLAKFAKVRVFNSPLFPPSLFFFSFFLPFLRPQLTIFVLPALLSRTDRRLCRRRQPRSADSTSLWRNVCSNGDSSFSSGGVGRRGSSWSGRGG